MKYRTAELEGALLDAAVARLECDFVKPYSRDWLHGGPIVERERIRLCPLLEAGFWWGEREASPCGARGPTPLIAACRAYVASKFGDEVDL